MLDLIIVLSLCIYSLLINRVCIICHIRGVDILLWILCRCWILNLNCRVRLSPENQKI